MNALRLTLDQESDASNFLDWVGEDGGIAGIAKGLAECS
jgi:hypothetical protein